MRAFTLHNVISYDAETACHTLQPTTAGGPITLDLYAQDEEWLVQAGWDSVLVPLEIVLGSHEMAFGFKMAALTSKTADAYFLEVTTVHADAAAARSGLKGRDKIISVNGVTGTAKQMQRELQGKHKLELLVVRGGEVSEGGESSIGGGGGGGYEGGDDDGGGGGDDNDGGGGGNDGDGPHPPMTPEYAGLQAALEAAVPYTSLPLSIANPVDGPPAASSTTLAPAATPSNAAAAPSNAAAVPSNAAAATALSTTNHLPPRISRSATSRGNWYLVTNLVSCATPVEIQTIAAVVRYIGSRPLGRPGTRSSSKELTDDRISSLITKGGEGGISWGGYHTKLKTWDRGRPLTREVAAPSLHSHPFPPSRGQPP